MNRRAERRRSGVSQTETGRAGYPLRWPYRRMARVGLVAPITAIAVLLVGLLPAFGQEDEEWVIDEPPPPEATRAYDVSVGVGVTPRPYGGGGALWVGIPMAHQGLFEEVNDALFVEVGVLPTLGLNPGDYWGESVGEWSTGWSLRFPVMARWTFYINEDWAVFGKLGPSWELALFDRANPLLAVIPSIGGGFGTFSTLTGNLRLRLDVNTDLIAVGLAWVQ